MKIVMWMYGLKNYISQVGWYFIKSFDVIYHIMITLIITKMILKSISIFFIFLTNYLSMILNIIIIFILLLSIIVIISMAWKTGMINPFQFNNENY